MHSCEFKSFHYTTFTGVTQRIYRTKSNLWKYGLLGCGSQTFIFLFRLRSPLKQGICVQLPFCIQSIVMFMVHSLGSCGQSLFHYTSLKSDTGWPAMIEESSKTYRSSQHGGNCTWVRILGQDSCACSIMAALPRLFLCVTTCVFLCSQ